jgi:hypothetical protein
MKSVSRLAAGLALAAFALTATAALAAGKTANVKIVNKSEWTIHELYLSPVDDEAWGPDQLQQHVIKPGETFTLSKIPCNSWDVRLVDEDGDECVVGGVDICGASDTWVINSKDLLACQAAGQ